jgi:F0F1-type ATP synthase delta subunit
MAKAKTTKAKKVEEVVETPKEKVDGYSFEVHVNDVTFKTKAVDLKSALTEFIKSPEFPFGIKTRVFMRFGKGKKIVNHTIPVVIARRLFSILSHKANAVEILAIKLTNKFNE